MTALRPVFLFLCLNIFCIPASAESVLVSISGSQIKDTTSTDFVEHIKPLVVKVGNTTLRLNTRRLFNIKTNGIFLQGRHKKLPIAASIIGGELRIVFPGKVTGSRKSRQRIYTLRAPAKNGSSVGRLSSIPASVFAHATCGASHAKAHSHNTIAPSIAHGMGDTDTLVATIHTYTDSEWLAIYGNTSNDTILQIINEAESIYESQLRLRFRIVGQTLLQNMSAVTTPGNLLGEFKQNQLAQDVNADIKYLFSGKEMDGTTIGIAFVSALCYDPQYAYGLSQPYWGAGYLFAHEIGHIFGAMHDSTSFGLMYPSILLGENRKFSQISLNQINNHIMNYGSCLSLETLPPNLTTAKLRIVRSGRVLRGTLTTSKNIPLPNIKIVLSINNRRVVVKTNNSGDYTYRIPNAKKRAYVIYATTQKQEVQSAVIWGRF